MLQGELGVGKTTFSRFLINNIFKLNNLEQPKSIRSPTYPILLTYKLDSFEIYHYDFYRLKNSKELEDLDILENLNNCITIIEWPELLIGLPFKRKYYLINLDLHSETKRIINIDYYL